MTMHKIPAREVVPGMLVGWPRTASLDRYLVTDVKTLPETGITWLEMVRETGYAFASRQMVTVSLPGPSPRQLLCTCAYAIANGVWSRPPRQHATHCLVAPNLDPVLGAVHGGVLLWPVGAKWGGSCWGWDMDNFSCSVERLQRILSGQWHDKPAPGWEQDRALRAFCHPPHIPDSPTELERLPTPWAAHGDEVYL